MRNLLGRLHARSPEELGRIAAAWQVPVSGGDKLGQVSQLYRAMSDPRAARDMWERLPADERALIAQLALGEETARSLGELATAMDRSEAEIRQTATRLYHKGIIAREGDDDPLPVGEAPRLFLPRELADKFQRVQDEIDAGDVSGTPLRTLMSLLDEREVEVAAETWGVRVIPGIRTRDELTRQLLQHVGEASRLAAVERSLKRDAARVWEAARNAPHGRPVALGEAMTAAGLNADDARQAHRARQALTELEEALLVWHTYREDGSRWLFVPAEIRSPRIAPATESPAPEKADPPAELPNPSHPHAVAWDLLSLLRALSPPQDQRIFELSDAPRGWLRRLAAGLWNREAETPPPGYLEFLVDLARVEGLLSGGDPAVEEPFEVTPKVRAWRDRSFPEQTELLRAAWLGSTTWIEGEGRDDVDVWGADWPGFRFKLLAHLSRLEPGAFYQLDAVASWLAERDPEMPGSTFEVATARSTEVVFDEAASRRAAVAEVVRATLESAFRWFGLTEVVRVPRKPRLLRVTDSGAALARGKPAPDEPVRETAPFLSVEADGRVRLRAPTPLRVWSLTAFAELQDLGDPATYRITERSIARALRAGFEIRHVDRFLANQSGAPLPAELAERIAGWSTGVRRVRMTRMLRLQPDDPALLAELRSLAQAAGGQAVELDGALFVQVEDGAELTPVEAGLMTRLREAGFSPQGLAQPRPATAARPRPSEQRGRGR